MGFLKDQLIDVIEYLDQTDNMIVTKYIREIDNNEIKDGAKLIVREGQAAVFVKGGQIADIFLAGTYSLGTGNLPILSKMFAWTQGFISEFKSDVYFVNLKQFTQNKWGTSSPFMMQDDVLGVVRVRGYGQYSFRVKDVRLFIKDFVGTLANFTTDDITGHFSAMLITSIIDTIGEEKIGIVELASRYLDISKKVQENLNIEAEKFGVEFSQVAIESISVPDEVSEYIDKNVEFTLKKNDLGAYTQFQTANAINTAAANEGNSGLAGFGTSLVFGRQMMDTVMTNQNQVAAEQNIIKVRCNSCGTLNDENAKFCAECGNGLQAKKVCPKCQGENDIKAKFCGSCGENLENNG